MMQRNVNKIFSRHQNRILKSAFSMNASKSFKVDSRSYSNVIFRSRIQLFPKVNRKKFSSLTNDTFNRKLLNELQLTANKHPENPTAQNNYIQRLVQTHPEEVIHRFERSSFAHDSDSVAIYMEALGRLNRLHTSNSNAVMRALSNNNKKTNIAAKGGGMGGNPFSGTNSEGGSNKMLGSIFSREGAKPQQQHPAQKVNVTLSNSQFFKWQASSLLSKIVGTLLVVTFVGTLIDNIGDGIMGESSKSFTTTKPEKVKNLTLDDVKGCEEAKEELSDIVEFLKNPEKFTKMGGKLPRGVLLIGPPGTGKTLLAKAVAGEAGVPFLYASGSEFEEKYVGVGAQRIRKLFEEAKENTPCIIFIDELDAVGGKRNASFNNSSRQTVNELLTQLDGFDGNDEIIVLGATNFPGSLDEALLRPGRFDVHVTVPLPDLRGRAAILEHYLTDIPTNDNVDAVAIARCTSGVSGADLYSLVNSAAIKASKDNADSVTMEHMEWARDKVLMGPQRKSMVISEEQKRFTAFHEGGHAFIALITPGALPVHKATIMPVGQALGFVRQMPEDDMHSMNREQMLARLDVCMAGNVAEELVYGKDKVTSGGSSDLQQATRLARSMVTEYGMSDEVGPVHYASLEQQKNQMEISTHTRALIDREVAELLSTSRKRVHKLMRNRKTDLYIIANALMEHETLSGTELKDLLDGKPINR